MRSPLRGLESPLRFYSWSGVLPARVSPGAASVRPESWRYAAQGAVLLVYVIGTAAAYHFSDDPDCLLPNMNSFWRGLQPMGTSRIKLS